MIQLSRQWAFLLLFALSSCTSDQLDLSREAEMAYVDLLFALYHDQETAASQAADDLDFYLRKMQDDLPRPLNIDRIDDHLFHLGKAEWAYDDALESIKKGKLELARVQLDRATYEFSAAAPAAFGELYIGEMYPFLSSWLEVDHAVGDRELCSLNWDQFSHYARDAKVLWKQDKYNRPDGRVYALQPIDEAAFAAAHQRVNDELEAFVTVLKSGDQCHAQDSAQGVSDAVWALINLFGGKSVTEL